MNTLIIPILIMIGINSYVFVYYLVMSLHSKKREALFFSILCLCVLCYNLFCIGLYNSGNISEGLFWGRLQVITLSVGTIFMMLFIFEFTGHRNRKPFYLVAVITFIDIMAFILLKNSPLTWMLEKPLIKQIVSAGESITYYEAEPGFFVYLQSITGLMAFFYIIVIMIRYACINNHREALPILMGLSIFFITTVSDTLISFGVYRFIYTLEYGYLFVVLGMVFSLSVRHAGLETALRESELHYRLIADNASDLIWTLNLRYQVIYISPSLKRLTGFEHESPEPLSPGTLLSGNSHSLLLGCLDELKQHPPCADFSQNLHLELEHARRNGTFFTAGVSISMQYDTEGALVGFLCISRDITERKNAEIRLAEEKERLLVTLRSIGDGVIVTDERGRIVLLNEAAEHLTGWRHNDAAGANLPDVFCIINEKTRAVCQNPVDTVLRTNSIAKLGNQTILVSKHATERFITDSAAPIVNNSGAIIGVVLVFQDITEKYQTQKELQKIQKLESIGILAGGIAHDFNNILTAIIGNLSLARIKLEEQPADIVSILDAVEQAAERATRLTNQLLTFAHGGAPITETASLSEVIRDSVDFVLRGSMVRCDFAFENDLPPVEIDRAQISQVIQNLVINAAQAMPNGGTIEITAYADCTGLPGEQADSRHVAVSITDHGIGISPEDIDKIFDPYYSKKASGTGLGLSIAYSIIGKHNGRITVQSEPAKGSTFTVHLPVSKNPVVRTSSNEHIPVTEKGRILVLEDEPEISALLEKLLNHLGYTATTVANGTDAIQLYERALRIGQPYQAVILDLTIPGGLGGKETIRRLLDIDPEVRAIVSSGYSNDPVMAQYKSHGFANVIAKPYSMEDLGRKLRETLS